MREYALILKGEKLTIQRASYIEDGWYIEITGDEITLFEIPQYGGKEYEVGKYQTILEAIKKGESFT
jgi:hypothetical protein